MTRLAAFLLVLAAAPGLAQDKIVPIEQEPRHVLKFQNSHVRFFDVQLPPGYQALWHTHLYDGVFVNIEPSPTITEAQVRLRTGGPEESLTMAPADFKWRDSLAPVTLVNVGPSAFHAVDIVVK